MSAEPLLTAVNVSKRFGRLWALENVTFSLQPGEVLGLVGRRAAGKSTLLQILAGYYPPQTGQLLWRGRPVKFTGPAEAQRRGLQLVHQRPLLSDQLDVVQNIFLGREADWRARLGFPNLSERMRQARAVLAELDTPEDLLNERVDGLTDEQRQIVALARVLCRPAPLILLDDALAGLSFQRQERLLALIRRLAAQGTAFILTSDNLQHLSAVTGRILVLYEGRLTADRLTRESTPREIVELIVGSAQNEQVTPIIWALESYHQAQQQAEELRRSQTTLQENLQARDSLNQQLLHRLRDQVTALDQLNLALQAAQRRLMTEREAERKALARELHDSVIQDLLSFNYRLEELEGHAAGDAQRAELADLRVGIRAIVGDLRQLCSDLRPPTIDSHGLPSAIRSHAQDWADKTGIQLALEVDARLGRLPEAVELSVFRIVQEALNNVRKHAAARRVRLSLQRTDGASLRLRLEDDGQGLPQPVDLASLSARNHYGLLGISERVALLGGSMRVESRRQGGVVLNVEIPSPSP
ncbi:MAG: ATP-binding cassette domain-containing protein [Anaerolineales bacterium]|nr:ATP-binding cassette domain-containing protein [Anaerolineales bacterium]